MMARPITMPAAPVRPCANRAATRTSIDGASTAARLASTQTAAPIISGLTLPKRSDSGPKTNCPLASPSRKAVRVSCTAVGDVCKSVTIAGNAGR